MPAGTVRECHPNAVLEVNAHHSAAECWATDLSEPGRSEDVEVADVQLAPGHILSALGDHGIALQRTGSALTGEVNRSACKRIAQAAAAEPDRVMKHGTAQMLASVRSSCRFRQGT